MGGTRDMEPALPCTPKHVHQISIAQNYPSTPLTESQGPQCRGKHRPGRPFWWPQLQHILREGLGRSKRCQTQGSWLSAGASSEDISPAQVLAAGTQPQGMARTEEKQLSCSGAMQLANNRSRTPLINVRSSAELVRTTQPHWGANLTGEEHWGSRAKLHPAPVNSTPKGM